MSKRKSDEFNVGEDETDKNLHDLPGFDPMDIDDDGDSNNQVAKRARPNTPQDDPGDSDDSLPLSPSAFRLQYREPAKEVQSSSPVQDPPSTTTSEVAGLSEEDISIHTPTEENVSVNESTDAEAESNPSDDTILDDEERRMLEDAVVQSLRDNLKNIKSTVSEPTGPWGLPKEVFSKILKYVFPVADTVKPWFKCYMSHHGCRGWVLAGEAYSTIPNIDASILRVNREFYKAGTDILYGSNHFRFADRPDAAKWFFNQIGDRNVKKIQLASFEMNSGWRPDRRDPEVIASPFENCFEEDWQKCLVRLHKAGARLVYLGVTIQSWTPLDEEPDYDEENKEELELWRGRVLEMLGRLKGVGHVAIHEVGGPWLGRLRARDLALQMQQE